jgi:cell division protein FtsQ
MKKKTKIISILLVVLLVVLVVVANIWRRQSLVREVRVDIDYCGGDTLVTDKEVADLVKKEIPTLTSQMLREVDLRAVEKAAAKSPFLRQCEAGTTIGGSVVVFAKQRRPIVRVCSQNQEYYLDDEGFRVPVSHTGSCDVIVASGHIPYKGQGLKDVWTLALFFDQHQDVAPLFDQIYREKSGDLYVTPKLGNHVVEVGSVENLEEKFHNLMALYTRGLPQAGWETYKKVSVKYRGQVVCTKRNNN